MDLRTTNREVAGHLVLAIDGAADLAALPALHDALQRLVSRVASPASAAPIAVEIDGVTVLDDATLGLLLGAAAAARSQRRGFRVICSDERLRRRLADTRFDQVVDIARSLTDAVADRPGTFVGSGVHAIGSIMNERDELLHIALPADWDAARATGEYRVSTRGRSLDDEGFIHCSHPHQFEGVANRFYGDVTELILLHLDDDLIDAEIRMEPAVGAGDELFPHIYGPIPTDAVVATTWWDRDDDGMWRKPVTM